jgi:tRNA threonylcarbamoyladenosine biosynthesis protein TsaB
LTILALDTTSEFGSVAVRRAGETIAEIHLHSPEGFGHVIFSAIEDVLAQANTRLDDIDCFAAASGPGSFTGVRVGLSAIKGLAEALGKPAVAISNLRALSLFGHAALRAVVLDARRGEVYGAVYDAQTRIVLPETVSTRAAWLATIPLDSEVVSFEDGPRHLASAVARCAEIDGPAGWRDPVELDANYVRRSDAELSWKEHPF